MEKFKEIYFYIQTKAYKANTDEMKGQILRLRSVFMKRQGRYFGILGLLWDVTMR